jgi:hypothetical protein
MPVARLQRHIGLRRAAGPDVGVLLVAPRAGPATLWWPRRPPSAFAGGVVSDAGAERRLEAPDVAAITPHVEQASAVARLTEGALIGTANQAQGSERAAVAVVHPLARHEHRPPPVCSRQDRGPVQHKIVVAFPSIRVIPGVASLLIVACMTEELAHGAGQQGVFGNVLATRGTRATPEAPFVIEHREALIYMLCLASELEHAIMCQYLYAAFSMKQSLDEGLTAAQLHSVDRWRQSVAHVASQEMLHLALVQNLLTSVGAAPHLSRPNLPPPPGRYPPTVSLTLLPFGERALRHFMFLERPEGMALADPLLQNTLERAVPAVELGEIVPQLQDFATIGHLYRSIEDGLRHLSELYGEKRLFCGPPRAQARTEHFGWSELVTTHDSASAQRAIDTIIEQGEGPRGDWQSAHFGQFVKILDEYLALRDADPTFEPARPVLPANVRCHERSTAVPLITDPTAVRCTDLFNVSYELLLLVLQRYFAHTSETDAQLKVLADVALGLMFEVIKPLGQLVTRLPVGQQHADRTAGPSFELFYESDYVLPHQHAAWLVLEERLRDAAAFCKRIAVQRGELDEVLAPVGASLDNFAESLASGRAGITP